MVNFVFLKPFGLLAAILGAIQAITWSILAVIAILTYNGPFSSVGQDSGTMMVGDTFSQHIGAFFSENNKDLAVTGAGLLVWSIFYLILSLVWIGTSMFLLYAVSMQKINKLKRLSTRIWSVTTFLVCALDFSLTVALGVVFDDVNQLKSTWGTRHFAAWVACGVLMTIAARGFVLWIVNLALAIILLLVECEDNTKTSQLINQTEYNNPRKSNPYTYPMNQSPAWKGQAPQNGSGNIFVYPQSNNYYQVPSPKRKTHPGGGGFDWIQGDNKDLPKLSPTIWFQ